MREPRNFDKWIDTRRPARCRKFRSFLQQRCENHDSQRKEGGKVRGAVMAGKILIVEDTSRLAESLAILLNEAGYETSLAKDSGQGIGKALTERPDLILSDLNLPGRLRYLKRFLLHPAFPLLFLPPRLFVNGKQKHSKRGQQSIYLSLSHRTICLT